MPALKVKFFIWWLNKLDSGSCILSWKVYYLYLLINANKSGYGKSVYVSSQRRSDRQTDSSCLLSGMAAETETKQDENFIRCGRGGWMFHSLFKFHEYRLFRFLVSFMLISVLGSSLWVSNPAISIRRRVLGSLGFGPRLRRANMRLMQTSITA